MAFIASRNEANGPHGLVWNEENGFIAEVSEETTGLKGMRLDYLLRDLRGIDGFSEVSAPSEAFTEENNHQTDPLPPKQGPGSSKQEWLAYADRNGIVVDNAMTYQEIIGFIENAVQQEQASTTATE